MTFILASCWVAVPNVSANPTINKISNVNAGQLASAVALPTINLSFSGNNAVLTSAVSDNLSLVKVAGIAVTDGGDNATGTIVITPEDNKCGFAKMTVTVTDDDGPTTTTFLVIINPEAVALAMNQDVGQQANQIIIHNFTSTATPQIASITNDNPLLLLNSSLTTHITAGDVANNGDITFTPAAGVSGVGVYTVTITTTDSLATDASTYSTFQVKVTVNPVFSGSPYNTVQNAPFAAPAQVVVPLTLRADAAKNPSITLSSDNASLVNAANIIKSSAINPSTDSGSLVFSPVANKFGIAVISVTLVTDDGSATLTKFTVNVKPYIAPITISDSVGIQQNVPLVGIDDSGGGYSIVWNSTTDPSSVILGHSEANLPATLRYTPVGSKSGVAVFNYTYTDTTSTKTFTFSYTVNITHINQAPSFSLASSQIGVAAGANFKQKGFVYNASAGEAGQSLISATLTATPTASPFFNMAQNFRLTAGAAGQYDIDFTLMPNATGTNIVTVKIQDDGTTLNGGVDTTIATFKVVASTKNIKPQFALLNRLVQQNVNSAASKLTNFASAISAGSATESAQTIKFYLTASSNAFFKTLPAIDTAGSLTFAVNANYVGFVPVKVYAQDNGGRLNGGYDTSDTNTFYIAVTNLDSGPIITGVKDLTVLESSTNGVSMTVGISDVNHANVNVSVAIITGGSILQSPTVTGTGTNRVVSIIPAPYKNGSATAIVTASDGVHATPTTASFKITVTPVNNAPVFNMRMAPVSGKYILQNDGQLWSVGDATANPSGLVYNYANYLHDLNYGAQTTDGNYTDLTTDEDTQTATFTITHGFPSTFFKAQPKITWDGVLGLANVASLAFTVNPGQYGTNDLIIKMVDSGGKLSGGNDTFSVTNTLRVARAYLAPTIDPNKALPPILTLKKNFGTTNISVVISDLDTPINKITVLATPSDPTKILATVTGTNTTRTLTLTSVQDQSTAAAGISLTLTADDNDRNAGGTSATATPVGFKVVINDVNTAPRIAAIKNQTVNENAVGQDVTLTVSDDTDGNDALLYTIANSQPGLVTVTATAAATPTGAPKITITPVADQNSTTFGSAVVTVTVTDLSTPALSTSTRFLLTVNAVNVRPTFSVVPTTLPFTKHNFEHIVPNIIQQVIVGPANESKQTWKASVSVPTADSTKFTKLPTIDTAGALHYTPSGTAAGAVTFTFLVQDSGGTLNGGNNTSLPATATLTIPANPFAASGQYSGLFYDTSGALKFAKAGYVDLNLDASGAYTGYCLWLGTSNQFSGTFGLPTPTTVASTTVIVPGSGVILNLAVDDVNKAISGSAADGVGATFTAANTPLRLVHSTVGTTDYVQVPGNYNLVIQVDTAANSTLQPVGDGFGWVNVDTSGRLNFSGYLGDATPIQQQTIVSKNNEWPLYVPAYTTAGNEIGSGGGVFGWIVFDPTTYLTVSGNPMDITLVSQNVTWDKLANTLEPYYKGVAYTITPAPEISYFEPWLGWNGLDLGSTDAVFIKGGVQVDGGYANSIAVTLAPNTLGFDSIDTSGLTHAVTMKYDPSWGYITGTLTDASGGTGPTISFYGIFLQRNDGVGVQPKAHGFFLNPATGTIIQSGQFLLQ